MDISDKMDKYLNKKKTYKVSDTIDKLFKQSIDKSKLQQDKYSKKMDKMIIRDAEGNIIFEFGEGVMVESEDGSGTMTYTAMHPRYRYGKNITCPFCNKTIDLRKIK